MKKLCFLICLLMGGVLFAQNGIHPTAGARGAALGGTGLTFTDVHALFTNQAGLADVESVSALISAQRRFGLAEIQELTAGAALPAVGGAFGLSVSYFGSDAFHEQRIGLAYGRRLFDALTLGGQVFVQQTVIPDYGNNGAVSFELGIQSKIAKDVSLAVHVSNPIQVEQSANVPLATVLSFGASYSPSQKVDLLLELEKDQDFASRVQMGIAYRPVSSLEARIGIRTAPVAWSFGAGYRISDKLSIEVAGQYHQILGFTPVAGIVFVGK